MRRIPGVRCAVILGLVAGAAACSDDDPVGPEDLSLEEVELMMEAFQNAGIMGGPFMPFMGGLSRDEGVDGAAVLFDEHSQSFDEVLSCPRGGSVRYEGTVTEGENQVNAQLTVTPQSCQSSDGDGNVWTFDGDPHLQFNMDLAGDDEFFEMSGSQEGAIAFQGDLGSGSCSWDVSYSFSGDQTGGSGQVSGTVCGQSMSYSF